MVRPNRSLPVAGMIGVVTVLSAQAAGIGAGFALMGAWLILPFAGLEVAALGLLCSWWYRHRDDCELITIEPDWVRIVKRRGGGVARHEFPRHWARVRLDRPPGNVGPTRVLLGSHGRFVTLGEEINDDQRALLALELRRLLH